MSFLRSMCAVLLASLAALHAMAAQTNTFAPVADTVIYFDGSDGPSTTGASNGRGENLSVGQTAGGVVRRSLLRFDLSSVLPGSVVLSAELSLFESRSRGNYNVSLHRVLTAWGEGASNGGSAGGSGDATQGDATWLRAVFPGTAWTAPGGDFAQQDSATTFVAFASASYAWSSAGMVADVQSWIDAPATNHGWIMIGVEEGPDQTAITNAKLFGSRESGAMPALALQVSPVPEPAAITTMVAGMALIGWRLRGPRRTPRNRSRRCA